MEHLPTVCCPRHKWVDPWPGNPACTRDGTRAAGREAEKAEEGQRRQGPPRPRHTNDGNHSKPPAKTAARFMDSLAANRVSCRPPWVGMLRHWVKGAVEICKAHRPPLGSRQGNRRMSNWDQSYRGQIAHPHQGERTSRNCVPSLSLAGLKCSPDWNEEVRRGDVMTVRQFVVVVLVFAAGAVWPRSVVQNATPEQSTSPSRSRWCSHPTRQPESAEYSTHRVVVDGQERAWERVRVTIARKCGGAGRRPGCALRDPQTV